MSHRFCVFLSTRSVTTKSCTSRWRTIAQVSLGGFRAFSDGLFQHLFRLVVHSLSFRKSVFGSATTVLLDNIARD